MFHLLLPARLDEMIFQGHSLEDVVARKDEFRTDFEASFCFTDIYIIYIDEYYGNRWQMISCRMRSPRPGRMQPEEIAAISALTRAVPAIRQEESC